MGFSGDCAIAGRVSNDPKPVTTIVPANFLIFPFIGLSLV
ncbi:hypothetical protein NIES2104_36690 [Leptolyngbya sp. NIES-2104]|nr:hypothetical protein NIES2104_36690 [Leptolyngbya sp. NIES-2104]